MNWKLNLWLYKADWQIMLRLSRKKRLDSQGNHSVKVQRVQWWHKIVKFISMTLHVSNHLQLVNPSEQEACCHHKRILLQWVDQRQLAVPANGIGWWKKEKNSLRQVPTLKMIPLLRKSTDKSSVAKYKIKQITNKQTTLRQSTREWQLSEGSESIIPSISLILLSKLTWHLFTHILSLSISQHRFRYFRYPVVPTLRWSWASPCFSFLSCLCRIPRD